VVVKWVCTQVATGQGQGTATVITLICAGQQSRCRMTVSRHRAASDQGPGSGPPSRTSGIPGHSAGPGRKEPAMSRTYQGTRNRTGFSVRMERPRCEYAAVGVAVPASGDQSAGRISWTPSVAVDACPSTTAPADGDDVRARFLASMCDSSRRGDILPSAGSRPVTPPLGQQLR